MPKSRARLSLGRAISSVVERFLHTEEATGSIPVSPTMLSLESLSSHRDAGFSPKVESLDRTQDVGYTLIGL